MKKRRIVEVVSLGRSGTSVLTRGLKAIGVDLGDSVSSHPNPSNQKGLWEDEEIIALIMKILRSLNIYQWEIGGIDNIDVKKIPIQLRDSALSIIKRNSEKYDLYGFKDAASWRILPFWKSIFHELSIQPNYIIAVRNPVSTVDSIDKIKNPVVKTEQKSRAKIYILWLECFVTIMNETRGKNRLVVDYDHLLAEPEYQMLRIAKFLGISEGSINKKYFQEYLDQFIDKNLRHSCASIDIIHKEACFPDLMQNSYKVLQDLSADKVSTESSEVNDFFHTCYQQLAHLKSFFQAVNTLEDSMTCLRSALVDILLKTAKLPEK